MSVLIEKTELTFVSTLDDDSLQYDVECSDFESIEFNGHLNQKEIDLKTFEFLAKKKLEIV